MMRDNTKLRVLTLVVLIVIMVEGAEPVRRAILAHKSGYARIRRASIRAVSRPVI
jgi:hypothetical protein